MKSSRARLLIFIFLAVVVLLVVTPGTLRERPQKLSQNSKCSSNPNPIFTHDITDFDKIKFITPPGSIEEYGGEKILKSHSYVIVDGEVPIYAPIDSTLIEGSYYEEEGENQYSLFFDASCEVFYIFDHIWEPVDKIKSVLPNQPSKDTRTTHVKEPVEVKAGELIGHTRGTVFSHHFDFGVYNRELKRDFPNLEKQGANLYGRDYQALCPYDVFPDEMKQKYYSLFGNIKPSEPIPTLFCD